MDILEHIEQCLESRGALYNEIAVDLAAWRKSGEIIAGFTHLPQHEQLAAWARLKGYEVSIEEKPGLVCIGYTLPRDGQAAVNRQLPTLNHGAAYRLDH